MIVLFEATDKAILIKFYQSALSTAFSKTKIDPPPILQDGGIDLLGILGSIFSEELVVVCN